MNFRPLKKGRISCPEKSAQNHHSTLRNTSEERISHLHRGECMKSRKQDEVASKCGTYVAAGEVHAGFFLGKPEGKRQL
jgi:hypothetical protein